MNTPLTTAEIVERLRVKSNMINMGEKIAWGSETALMDEAAARLEAAEAELAETRKANAILDPAAESFHRRMVAAEAELAKVREALEPFLGDETMETILWGDLPDDATGTVTVKLADFRRAREALSRKGE